MLENQLNNESTEFKLFPNALREYYKRGQIYNLNDLKDLIINIAGEQFDQGYGYEAFYDGESGEIPGFTKEDLEQINQYSEKIQDRAKIYKELYLKYRDERLQNPLVLQLIDILIDNSREIVENGFQKLTEYRLRKEGINKLYYYPASFEESDLEWLKENEGHFKCITKDVEIRRFFSFDSVEEDWYQLLNFTYAPTNLEASGEFWSQCPVTTDPQWVNWHLKEFEIREKYRYLYDDLGKGIYHNAEEWIHFYQELEKHQESKPAAQNELDILANRFCYWIYWAVVEIIGGSYKLIKI